MAGIEGIIGALVLSLNFRYIAHPTPTLSRELFVVPEDLAKGPEKPWLPI